MEQKANLKEMTPKKRLEHIWEYYKVAIIGSLVVIIMAGSLIHHYVTYKEVVLNVMMINGQNETLSDPGMDEYFSYAGYDAQKERITVDTSSDYTLTEDSFQDEPVVTEAVSVRLAVGDAHVFAAPAPVFDYYASAGFLRDLREVFTDAELDSYKESLFYTKNRETGEIYPCGISPIHNTWMVSNGYYPTPESCVIGLTACRNYTDNAEHFLRYILNFE